MRDLFFKFDCISSIFNFSYVTFLDGGLPLPFIIAAEDLLPLS
jgi:hypothetical protein